MIHKGLKNILDYYTQNSIEDLDIYQNICRVYLDEYKDQKEIRAKYFFNKDGDYLTMSDPADWEFSQEDFVWGWWKEKKIFDTNFIRKRFEEKQ